MFKIIIAVIGIISFLVGFAGIFEFAINVKSDFSYGGHMSYWIEDGKRALLGLIIGLLGYSIAGICFILF
ncbi:hypothetical protein [Streptococcus ferus]|uniref:hypothetical protein n=1 Tax=Streptococcus ferus TaxID=1345 RepID=UPI00359F3D3D